MNRRSFFGTLAGTAAAASATASTSMPETTVPGWRIKWSGWREPAHQMIRVGFWWAQQDPLKQGYGEGEYPCYYATTTHRHVCHAFPLDVVDLSRDWKADLPASVFEPPERFEAAKRDARARLIEKLVTL